MKFSLPVRVIVKYEHRRQISRTAVAIGTHHPHFDRLMQWIHDHTESVYMKVAWESIGDHAHRLNPGLSATRVLNCKNLSLNQCWQIMLSTQKCIHVKKMSLSLWMELSPNFFPVLRKLHVEVGAIPANRFPPMRNLNELNVTFLNTERRSEADLTWVRTCVSACPALKIFRLEANAGNFWHDLPFLAWTAVPFRCKLKVQIVKTHGMEERCAMFVNKVFDLK